MAIHKLEVLVENEPGVLARIAGLFARRTYNIDSLVVGPTENSKISKMIIEVSVEGHSLEQVIAQLDKLINVDQLLVYFLPQLMNLGKQI